MNSSPVLIAGSGRLADRLEALLRPTRAVARVDAVHPGSLAPFEDALERADIRAAAALYIVDDGDAANVQFALAALKVRPELAITMALSNRGLVPQFLAAIREKHIPVMIADATVANTLVDAAVDQASAVASLVNDDLVNLEVGLNARALHPRIRVILRIFDGDTANELRQRLNIHYAISTSAIAAQAMLEREARG